MRKLISCRACGDSSEKVVCEFSGLSGRQFGSAQCSKCGCWSAEYDESAHLDLHRENNSVYGQHNQKASLVKQAFARGDIKRLRKLLIADDPKNRHVLRAIDELAPRSSVVEFGCSRGYLSTYAILRGHNFIGVDVSLDAINSARADFGPYFTLESDFSYEDGLFDLVYHVGTVGCVADPACFIESQKAALKVSGGRLLFNSPNVASAVALGDPWVRGTLPPDLTLLFSEQYWTDVFANTQCSVTAALDTPYKSTRRRSIDFASATRQLRANVERRDVGHHVHSALGPNSIKALLRPLAVAFCWFLYAAKVLDRVPAEFGIWVDYKT